MATKRQLKSYIHNLCGEYASEILFAAAAFPEIKAKEVRDIIAEIAAIQSEYLSKTSISFDKAPRDFESRALYNKERAKYFHKAYTALLCGLEKDLEEKVMKKMNAALPDDVKAEIKKVIAQ